jgi:hypothetical protein
MILLGQLSMVVGYAPPRVVARVLGAQSFHLPHLYLDRVYIHVSMFDLFNTRPEMLLQFFRAQTFLLEGEL